MGKILQRCDVCKNFHVAFVVKDPESGEKTHLCSNCWKKRYGSQREEGVGQQEAELHSEMGEEPALPSLERKPYPILEHDPSPEAMIEPKQVIKPRLVAEHCVICFFKEVLDKVVNENQAQMIVENKWEDGPHPLYEIRYREQRLAFFHPGVGGAIAANLLEEVIAFGCRKFIVCGGCGVLEKDTQVGHLIIVSAAIRDEGVSYHYLPPAREVVANTAGVEALEKVLQQHKTPYQTGKTWTTDAPYRETPLKIGARRAEGCLTVEMEAASLMAVAEFRGVTLGQVLYGGDDLSGSEWDERGWQDRKDIREKLFWLAAEACLEL
jgi:uridine phosphorylase